MQVLPVLKPGDKVEIIAPASRCTDEQLLGLKALLESWQLHCIVAQDIFAKDLLCANTDEARLQHFIHAVKNPETKAIVCARGGYGSMRIIPQLATVMPSKIAKIFVGMSDTTALQLYMQQHWSWPSVHGSLLPDKYSKESLDAIKALFFADVPQLVYANLAPLNEHAKQHRLIHATITGGNLTLVQTSIGTDWQINAKNKIVLLEEVSERGYRVDRMLEHLSQTGLLEGARAILFGDFIQCEEPNGQSLIQDILLRFAKTCECPVVQIAGIGHGYVNNPLLLGTPTALQLGSAITLTCFR